MKTCVYAEILGLEHEVEGQPSARFLTQHSFKKYAFKINEYCFNLENKQNTCVKKN
jgi:hypothetical protein